MDRSIEINKLHEELWSEVMTTPKAIRIGELLTEQKAECGHGKWYPWLKANVKFSRQSADRYRKAYEKSKTLAASDLPIHKLIGEKHTKSVVKLKGPVYEPPAPTADEQKFEAAKVVQDYSPLSEDYKQRIKKSLEANWFWMKEEHGFNNRQLEQAIDMCLDFWTEKQEEIVKKKFQVA